MDKTIIIIALFLFSSCSSQKENQEHNSIYSYADLRFFQPQHLENGLYIENGAHYFWPKYYTNETMIDFLPADYLMEKKEEITHPLLKSIVERMEEDSNPVLMLCRE